MGKNRRFKDRVVIVTGASSGIGRAAALEFAREGAKTVLISRSEDRLEKVANEIRPITSDVLVVKADVSVPEEVKGAVSKVLSTYGRIDILFNNAGSSSVGAVEHDEFVERTRRMIEVDYFGTVYVTKEVLPVMRRQQSGHIMNMSSVVGKKRFPDSEGTPQRCTLLQRSAML